MVFLVTLWIKNFLHRLSAQIQENIKMLAVEINLINCLLLYCGEEAWLLILCVISIYITHNNILQFILLHAFLSYTFINGELEKNWCSLFRYKPLVQYQNAANHIWFSYCILPLFWLYFWVRITSSNFSQNSDHISWSTKILINSFYLVCVVFHWTVNRLSIMCLIFPCLCRRFL